ncbi:MAG: universal stress protein [Desulfobacterales bacterium]|nr:universal stress protein [Desulfobacterales bacterium]
MFTKILTATDKVTVRDITVLIAQRIANQANAELHIIHVLESVSTKNCNIIRHYLSGEEMLADSDYKKTIKNEISRNYAGLLNNNGNSTITVVTGFPWQEIIRYSRKISADLIVMGSLSLRAQTDKAVSSAEKVGNNLKEVIVRGKCPVIITNKKITKKRVKIKSVLACVDFSKSCIYALMFAEKLARYSNAKLFIFHMIPIPPQPKYSQADYEADFNTVTEKLRKICPDSIKRLDREYCIWGGSLPHTEVLKCAEKKDADLIVMGSHTKEKHGKWYTGSAVEGVAYRSNCPVIVLTDPTDLKPMGEH